MMLDASGLQITDGLVVFRDSRGTPTTDQIKLGDANCYWANDGTSVTFVFETDGYLSYNRTSNALSGVSIPGTPSFFSFEAGAFNVQTNYISIIEIADPGVAATNAARLFTKDNGAGKTQLMVRFQSGAAIQLAIEA
jgi:hypothetical protein